MNVVLFQLDGKIPNIALMRIAAHHRRQGDQVTLRWPREETVFDPVVAELFEKPDRIYASLIFSKTRPLAESLLTAYPGALIGGTGWDVSSKLEAHGILTLGQDYSIYPDWKQSIGFSQRGCRLNCGFCVVPRKEGKVQTERSILEMWRGDPWPRELVLLDNDFFGDKGWPEKVEEIEKGGFKVNFNQGINARFLTDETAAAIGKMDYRDVSMSRKQIYTAWDNSKDEKRLFRGLEALVRHGVKPRHIMVYMLLGYWPWSRLEDWETRRVKLREFGAIPYPMPYVRTPLSVGFQRWVVGAYDKRVTWTDWEQAGYRPERLGLQVETPLFEAGEEV